MSDFLLIMKIRILAKLKYIINRHLLQPCLVSIVLVFSEVSIRYPRLIRSLIRHRQGIERVAGSLLFRC